jgi:hypothetical protein
MNWGMILQGIGNTIQQGMTWMGGEAELNIQKLNAKMDMENARLSRESAAVQEKRQRQMSYKQLSAMKAGYGASGVVSNEGSPMDVLEESAANAELDALLIRHRGEVEAWSAESSASIALYEGRIARTAGHVQGFATHLQQAGSAIGSSGGFSGGK